MTDNYKEGTAQLGEIIQQAEQDALNEPTEAGYISVSARPGGPLILIMMSRSAASHLLTHMQDYEGDCQFMEGLRRMLQDCYLKGGGDTDGTRTQEN